MQQIAWVIAAVCALAAVVFLWLWLQARLARRAAEETLMDVQHALSQRGDSSAEFKPDVIYQLIAKGQISVDGRTQAFGVAQPDNGVPSAFLTTTNMEGLQAGDAFVTVHGVLRKVDTGAAPTVQAAAPAAAAAEPPAPAPSPSPAPTPAPTPAPVMPAMPVFDDDDGDIADRTIMFAPSRGSQPDLDDPYAGFPYLLVTAGPDEGKRFALPYTHATIGREHNNIIALSDQGASRLHCEIEYRRHEFVLKDHNSTNGTFHNGEQITEHALTFGDSVQVADTVMNFTCDGWEARDTDPDKAIAGFEACLEKEPDFVLALQHLAFLLERNVARKKEAAPLWKRITEIDQGR